MTLLALVTVTSLSMGVAPASVQQAAQALEDLQHEAALKLLPPEESIEGYSRAELISYFSTKALAQLGLKKEAEAAETFRRLLTFAPEWQLPDHYGPKVVTFVASLRAEADERGNPSVRFEGGQLVSKADSTGLAKQLEVSWRAPSGAKTVTLPLAPAQAAPWPAGERVEVWGRVLGLQGSTLVEWNSPQAPLVLEPAGEVRAAAPSKPLGRWAFVGLGAAAAGLVAGGVGTALAVSSQGAQQALGTVQRDGEGRITNLTQREAFALDAQARDQAGAATALFITSGVLVAAGVGLFVFDRVSVAPTPGGAMLTVPLDAHFALESSR